MFVLYFIGRNVDLYFQVESKNGQLSGVGDVTKHFMVKRELSGYIRGKVILDARHLVSFELLGAILGCLGVICSSA